MNGKKVRCYIMALMLYFSSTFGTLSMLFPYLPLIFVNKRVFHWLCDFSLRAWLSLAVFFLEKFVGIKIVLHESRIDDSKKFEKGAILIMNHRTRLDWMFYFSILSRQNALSHIKIILKYGLKKIPGPGWAMQHALFMFIHRKWEVDREIFTKFIDYYKNIQKKVFILIFPEGTNLTADTKKKSDKFAAENGLTPYAQVLHPRVTGFIHVFHEMRRNKMIDAVHDVTIGYRGGEIPENEIDFLNGKLPSEIHFYVRKFGLDEILDSNNNTEGLIYLTDQTLEDWLKQRWRAKEHFLKKFYEENEESFEGEFYVKSESGSWTLLAYPSYWIISTLFSFYLIQAYFAFKIYFAVAFLFYLALQMFKIDLDELIMKVNKPKSD